MLELVALLAAKAITSVPITKPRVARAMVLVVSSSKVRANALSVVTPAVPTPVK